MKCSSVITNKPIIKDNCHDYYSSFVNNHNIYNIEDYPSFSLKSKFNYRYPCKDIEIVKGVYYGYECSVGGGGDTLSISP